MKKISLNPGEIITLKVDLKDAVTLKNNTIDFDLNRGHILYVIKETKEGILCEIEEDIKSRNANYPFQYGPLLIPFEYLNEPESILEMRRINEIITKHYS